MKNCFLLIFHSGLKNKSKKFVQLFKAIRHNKTQSIRNILIFFAFKGA